MTIREAYLVGREHLAATGVAEPDVEAELLLRHALAWDRAQVYTRWDFPLDDPTWHRYRGLLDERATGRPVHYILGEREFMGLRFRVDERVLIPRPETEVLTELVIDFLIGIRDQGPGTSREEGGNGSPVPGPRSRVVVDVGAGSGCIAVSIAHFVPDVTVIATDISAGALEVAAFNARRHAVDGRIEFFEGDLFRSLPDTLVGRFDVVVSNPPYVPPGQVPLLPPEIRDHEPAIAVVGQGDGLDVHRRLVTDSPRWLRPGGLLALEVGLGQAAALRQFLATQPVYTEIRTVRDYAGIDRVLTAICHPQGTGIGGANT